MRQSDVHDIGAIDAETRTHLCNEFEVYLYGNSALIMPILVLFSFFSGFHFFAPLPILLFWWTTKRNAFVLARRHSPNLMMVYYGSAILTLLFGMGLLVGNFFMLLTIVPCVVFHFYFHGIWRRPQKRYKVETMK